MAENEKLTMEEMIARACQLVDDVRCGIVGILVGIKQTSGKLQVGVLRMRVFIAASRKQHLQRFSIETENHAIDRDVGVKTNASCGIIGLHCLGFVSRCKGRRFLSILQIFLQKFFSDFSRIFGWVIVFCTIREAYKSWEGE